MALLTLRSSARAPRRVAFAVAALGGAALFGCAAVAFFGPRDETPVFPHRVHVVEQGLDCVLCHFTEDGATSPLPPDAGQCALCHDDLDAEKPPHKRAAAFFVAPGDVVPEGGGDQEPTLALRPGLRRFSDEVRFDHTAHAAALGDDCLACHVGLDESERLTARDALTMSSCVDCHDARGREDTCATCHTVIDRTWSPPNHATAWTRLHGEASRDPAPSSEVACLLCHSQSSCTECHQSTPPENHDEFFRLRGHGVLADLSRESCATCHRADSCISCHQSTRPLSHHGSFGAPRNDHCYGCHFPLAGEGCATCHRGTPSHALAAPQPPDHVPGANCRQCHGAGAPLPHADDGSACALCHR